MRILTICYEYPPIGGGGATVCQALAEALVGVGHQVDVVTSAMADLSPFEERNGVRVFRVSCIRRRRFYATTAELLTQIIPSYRTATSLLERSSYDLCHCHFVVPSGVVAYMIWRNRRLPYVLTAHGSDIPGYNPDRFGTMHRLIRPAWRRIMRGSRTVTAPSHYLASLINRTIEIPVEVIPNGFTPPDLPQGERENRVLVATRMVQRKGVQHLIAALERVDSDWEVCIAGDGPYLETLKEMAAAKGVRARFLGFVPRETLARLYRSAKVFVFPSIQENFPLVLLEAMSAGCAVITTTASGCSEVVGDAALQVEPGNTGQLRDALDRLLKDEAEIARLRAAAVERARQFSWDRLVSRHEAVFRRALEARPA